MVFRCSCYSDNILSEEARSIKWLSRGYFIFCIWLMLGYFKSGRVLLMQLYYCHSSTTVRADCTENDSSTLHPTLQLKVTCTEEGSRTKSGAWASVPSDRPAARVLALVAKVAPAQVPY